MSKTKKRQVHLPEFKAKVGLEALRAVKTINEIGQEVEVFYRWHALYGRRVRRQCNEQRATSNERRGLQRWW